MTIEIRQYDDLSEADLIRFGNTTITVEDDKGFPIFEGLAYTWDEKPSGALGLQRRIILDEDDEFPEGEGPHAIAFEFMVIPKYRSVHSSGYIFDMDALHVQDEMRRQAMRNAENDQARQRLGIPGGAPPPVGPNRAARRHN